MIRYCLVALLAVAGCIRFDEVAGDADAIELLPRDQRIAIASVDPAPYSLLLAQSPLSLTFTKAPGRFEIGGDLASGSPLVSWSEDGLVATLTPAPSWPLGDARTLVVAYAELPSVTALTTEIAFDVVTRPSVVSITPSSILTADGTISILFDRTMATDSVVLSGAISGDASTKTWSRTNADNDTLTVSASPRFARGASRGLTVNGADLRGVSILAASVVFDVTAAAQSPVVVSVAPASNAALPVAQPIVVRFDQTMTPSMLLLSGSLAVGVTPTFSQTVALNDTLTLTPAGTWPETALGDLTIQAFNPVLDDVSLSLSYEVPAAVTLRATHPSDNTLLGLRTEVVLEFDGPVDVGTLALGGTINPGTHWETVDAELDTLTITPPSDWPDGARTLTVALNDITGNPISIPVLDFDVVPSIEETSIYDVIYVSATGSTDANPGTRALPKRTLRSAIDQADKLGSGERWVVAVGPGTFNVNSDPANPVDGPTHVVMAQGVSLYGSFGSTLRSREALGVTSVITDKSNKANATLAAPNRAVEFGSGLLPSTLISGFTINSTKADNSTGVWAHSGSQGRVQECRIVAGPGVFDSGVLSGGSKPIITRNTIVGDETTDTQRLIHVRGGDAIVWQNTLSGGGTGAANVSGIYIDAGSPAVSTNPSIVANVISAGSGTKTFGIRAVASGPFTGAKIFANTVSGGMGTDEAIALSVTDDMRIAGNYLFTQVTSGAGIERCISPSLAVGTTPIEVRYNAFFGCARPYWDHAGRCSSNGDGDNDGRTCTPAEVLTDIYTGASAGTGNMTPSALGFVSATDWHLAPGADAALISGGPDLCSLAPPTAYVSPERDGLARTPCNVLLQGIGWSIGAYER